MMSADLSVLRAPAGTVVQGWSLVLADEVRQLGLHFAGLVLLRCGCWAGSDLALAGSDQYWPVLAALAMRRCRDVGRSRRRSRPWTAMLADLPTRAGAGLVFW